MAFSFSRLSGFQMPERRIFMQSCDLRPSDESAADLLVRHTGYGPEQLARMFETGCISYVNEEYAVLHLPLERLSGSAGIPYTAIPSLYGLLDTTSMEQSGIAAVLRQPVLQAEGEGVLLGLIDTGIDYTNPLFRREDGSTRILGLWDQTLEGGGFSMEGTREASYAFLYGAEFGESAINEALQSGDPFRQIPSRDLSGHGTFLAGIAAGRNTGDFTGAAPGCSLGVVRLKPAKTWLRDYYQIPDSAEAYQENDILMGVTYLVLLAYRFRMPLVLCLGLGTNQGGHGGDSPLSQVLNRLQTFVGVTAVCAAGNEAGFRHHFMGQIRPDQAYEEAELRVGEGERGFIAELWADFPDVYTVSFLSPAGQETGQISLTPGENREVRFPLEGTVITLSYFPSLGPRGGYLAALRFASPSAGIWKIRVHAGVAIGGFFHIWLPIHGFLSDETVFLKADPYTTITGPGNADFPITVSTCNHGDGSLYIHSSRGYTRDGRVKPDLAAPGVDVYGPGVSSVPGEYPMTRMTGSSVAAAHAAGAAADLYSWGYVKGNYPGMNNSAVKALLARGAARNSSYSYPNREWGYGTLDLYQSFLTLTV